ncbi:MAG: TIGR04283 family arsenosugar biosynthesis glycosyltransferase [Thermodesulfovibrionales bacterium]
MISVIIPALNEAESIGRAIACAYDGGTGCEVIVVDGGSADDTVRTAASHPGVKVLHSEKGRAVQMNRGAAEAAGDLLLFLHADTVLEAGWRAALDAALLDRSVVGGAFSLAVDNPAWKFRLVEGWVSLRSRFCGLPYGDQAIFVRRGVFRRIGGYREIPLMEDVDLVERLGQNGRMVILTHRAVTSDRRWRRKGLLATAIENQAMMLFYRLGADPRRLALWYYR